jgi:hypothetical protein
VSLGGIESIEPQIKFDPNSGLPTGFGGRISFREPSEAERKEGKVAVDDLIDSCNSVLAAKKYQIWVLIDRLDVIFDGNPEKEKIALRSLFEVYKDFLKWDQIRPKIFIRDDIWKTISVGKFREASHLDRSVTLEWNERAILNLVARRVLYNADIVEFLHVNKKEVLLSIYQQSDAVRALFPVLNAQDSTIDFIQSVINSTADGTGHTTPREVRAGSANSNRSISGVSA